MGRDTSRPCGVAATGSTASSPAAGDANGTPTRGGACRTVRGAAPVGGELGAAGWALRVVAATCGAVAGMLLMGAALDAAFGEAIDAWFNSTFFYNPLLMFDSKKAVSRMLHEDMERQAVRRIVRQAQKGQQIFQT